MSFLPQKFPWPLCWYFLIAGNYRVKDGVISSGLIFVLCLMKISQSVQKLLGERSRHVDVWTWKMRLDGLGLIPGMRVGSSFPRVKKMKCEADHSPLSTPECIELYLHTTLSPLQIISWIILPIPLIVFKTASIRCGMIASFFAVVILREIIVNIWCHASKLCVKECVLLRQASCLVFEFPCRRCPV